MNQKNPFQKTVAESVKEIKDWKNENDGVVLGYLCTYAPEEIIHAAGVLPYRVFGTGARTESADNHLQAYACSLVRSAMGEALEKDLDFLDGAVFPHTCDSIQRLSDIWRLNAGMKFHFDVVHPVKLNTQGARKYMGDILDLFRKQLGEALGKEISNEDLSVSIRLFNRLRLMLIELYQIREERPDLLSGADVFKTLRASMTMERSRFALMLEQFLKDLNEQKLKPAESAVPTKIILAGGVCDHPDIYNIVEEAGAYVCWDDLCAGSRSFAGQIDENISPIEAINERYFERIECPAKHRSVRSRGERLASLVAEKNARGVIILQLKFCDPHAFDYPYIKETLDKADIPSLLIEVEDPSRAQGALKTRIETFVEMVKG